MKIHVGCSAILCGVVAIGFGGSARAQAGDTSAQDKTFVMNATEGSMAEIAQSRMALKKSKNADIQAYAQKMIDDHNMLIANMKHIADQMGVTPPTTLNKTHQLEAQRLASMSGDKFDMEYVKSMVADHHKTLGMFKNEEATTTNEQLKAAVVQGEPIIQAHTDMIDQMAQKMSSSIPPTGM